MVMITNILPHKKGVYIYKRDGNKKYGEFKLFLSYFFIEKKDEQTVKKLFNKLSQNFIDNLNEDYILDFAEKYNLTYQNAIEYLNPYTIKIEKTDINTDFLKVILNDNFIYREIIELLNKNSIRSYELDIPVEKKYLIDNDNLQMNLNKNELKILYYDIETYDIGEILNDEYGRIIPRTPILSISCIDNNGNPKVFINKGRNNILYGEQLMLSEFLEYLKKYDILIGWRNSKFDDVYIYKRCELHNLNLSPFTSIIKIDYNLLYEDKIFNKPDVISLDNVAEFELNIKKIDIKYYKNKTMGNGLIVALWEDEDIDKYNNNSELYKLIEKYENNTIDKNNDISLITYNLKDAYILYKLENKLKILDILISLANMFNILLQYTVSGNPFYDILLLREYHKKGILLQNKYNVKSEDKFVIHTIYLDKNTKIPVKLNIQGVNYE